MKKNVKYLGMAAAALLAVAPVVSTGVANAATSVPVTVTGNPAPSSTEKQDVTLSLSVANANQIASGTKVTALPVTLNSNIGTPKVNGDVKVYEVINGQVSAKAVDEVTAGHTYVVVADNVTVSGLKQKNDKGQVIPTTVNKEPQTVDIYGNVTKGTPVTSAPFFVPNTTLTGTPYFVESAKNQQVATGSLTINANSTVDALASAIVAKYQPQINGSATVAPWTAASIKSEVEASLKSANISVSKDGSFTSSKPVFNVVLTSVGTNGVKSQFTVIVSTNQPVADTSLNPIIKYNNSAVKAGSKVNVENASFNYVPVGGNVNVAEIKSAFTAVVSSKQPNTSIAVSVDTSKVNTEVAGVYPVTVSATNANGKTTTVTFDLTVGKKGVNYKTVNYVKGYYVYAWNINGNNKPVMSSTRFLAGTKVGVTGSPVTVNGISYYKLEGNTNLYIPAQYVDGTWKPEANKPANSGVTKVRGIARVTYTGRGRVALLHGNGKYIGGPASGNGYISKNTSWKVFAKKTIKGQTMYNLGGDQWVPARYVNFVEA